MYREEMRRYWRPLLGASIGMALGSALNHYMTNLFGPALIKEFGWSKADFALLGSLPLLMMFFAPLQGRFVDYFGARVAAITGFMALPVTYVAYTMMNGELWMFFTIWIVQHIFGVLTTTMVFCRVIVERFNLARGIALAIMMSAPPLAGAIAAPLLGNVIDEQGWRVGYFMMAAISGAGGLLAVLAMGRTAKKPVAQDAAAQVAVAEAAVADIPVAEGVKQKLTAKEFFGIVRQPIFLLIVAGMFLVNVPQVFASSQLKLIVMDSGFTSAMATWMISAYATGVIIGRLICGVALDRVPTHYVAIAALGLPAIGYCILASHLDATALVVFAVLVVGLAQGAEGDIGAYLISKRFDIKNFSLLFSFVPAMIGVGGAAGSIFLSATLRSTESYVPFLLLSAAATLTGAALFGLTGSKFFGGTPERAALKEAPREAA